MVKGKGKKTFSKISTFDVRANHPFRLVIAKGSVVDFSYPPNPQCSAIVNSFLGRINNGSSNGFAGGVDGAVSDAGGRNLKEDRKNLTVSCSVGSAVITGPNAYGRLKSSYVIHASTGGWGDDQLLSSAYSSSLECGKSADLEAIAFCLLGSGGCRGEMTIDHVVKIGLAAIGRYEGYPNLKAVYMCAYTQEEADVLMTHARDQFPAAATLSIWKKLTTSSQKKPNDIVLTGDEVKNQGGNSKLGTNGNDSRMHEENEGQISTEQDQSSIPSRTESEASRVTPARSHQQFTVDSHDLQIKSMEIKQKAGVPTEPCQSDKPKDLCDLIETSSIDFRNKGFGDDKILVVSQALEETNTIESIFMNGNRLSMLDTRFTRALALNHTLKLLRLESNLIHAEGAGRLADALMVNETIEHIHLGRNFIRDEGATLLAEALQINQTVKSIDLHLNGIGNTGAGRMADAIAVNNSLLSVDLQRNQIEDVGGRSLADALRINNTVTKLELSYNPIDGAVQQKLRDILNGPRPLSMKKQANVKPSLFFGKLMDLGDKSNMNEKLDFLSMFITDVHAMKIYYTAVSIFQSSGVLKQEEASHHIQRGLSRTSETCSCSDSISCFKLILEKAETDNHIQRIDLHRYDNLAEVNRMESAPFIVNIIDAVKSNTARIEGLEANLEAIDVSLTSIKKGLKRQMKIQATVGFLCAALNAISFGVGGNIVEATIKVLDSIVDYSDLAHIQSVAAEWGEGCLEQFETGVMLATNECAEKLLHEAVKKKETITVISATAAMINAQYLEKSISINPSDLTKLARSSEMVDNSTDQPQRVDEDQFLTREKCKEEVMQWLLSYLPRLQKDDVTNYCECLIHDGFDSADMFGHVTEEDLPFMKKAHKRVLIHKLGKSSNDAESSTK